MSKNTSADDLDLTDRPDGSSNGEELSDFDVDDEVDVDLDEPDLSRAAPPAAPAPGVKPLRRDALRRRQLLRFGRRRAAPQAEGAAAAPSPVAVARPDRRYMRRARARRVRRTIRHVDPWSIFKVSLLLYLCVYVALMVASVLLWSAAIGSGGIDNVESFIEEIFSFETFALQGEEIFRGMAIIGIVLVFAGAVANVLMAILFNLISDLVGGVRLTVIEEDTARQPVI